MDIKEKITSLIDRQKSSIKSLNQLDQITNEDFIGRIGVSSHHHARPILDVQTLTPEAEQAVIDSLDSCYYELNNDVGEQELKKFPDIADIHVINGVRSRLRKQQVVITRRVSNLISQKQSLCAQEMEKIAELQMELCKAVTLCTDSRLSLNQGSDQFTAASLGILSNYSKRQKVSMVIQSLRTIRTLQMTDVQLQSLLKSEDYPGAIQLLLECQKAAQTFKYFKCISDLSTKLQETLEMTEEQLDFALSKVVLNFSTVIYEKLFIAYGLLGKVQTMMDQLHMHLTSHIHNCAFNIVLGYVELCNTSNDASSTTNSFCKMQYGEICKFVNGECFLSCFLDLSRGMWNILKSYQSIKKWHLEADKIFLEFKSNQNYIDESKKYINQKFEHGIIRIWQDVQAKVKTFILATNISHFKFDDFLKVLDVINTLIDIGEAFCGSKSETLHDSIKKHSLSFFQTHHWARMEELHMFLENEGWEICPVKPGFLATHLVEYKFLRQPNSLNSRYSTPNSSPKKIDKKSLFAFTNENFDPFDLSTDESIEEDIMVDELANPAFCDDDSDEDLPEELKRDFVEEHVDAHHHPIRKKELTNIPMVTNTTLTILRLFGKYIQMMKLLQPIAFDVLLCFCQLYEFYFYAIFSIFSEGGISKSSISPRLKTALKRIEDVLILPSEVEDVDDGASKFPHRFSFHQILDNSPNTLYNLPVRVAAVESLAFLGLQLQTLRNHIEYLTPASKKGFLHQFYANSVDMTSEVRHHVYSYVASRVIDYDGLLGHMSSVRWDIGELMSQHSAYVDILLRQLQILAMRLDELKRDRPLPPEAQDALWSCLIGQVNRTLLEGFSNAKKCTNEGRSLMQLDYQQFIMKLECLTTVRPFPDRPLIETYIKAYYLPEAALEEWISTNQAKYSSRQLISLVNCMSHVSKRVRQKLITLLEEDTNKK